MESSATISAGSNESGAKPETQPVPVDTVLTEPGTPRLTSQLTTKFINDERDRNFECGLCYEQFDARLKYPRILCCGHTYCEACLLKLEGMN